MTLGPLAHSRLPTPYGEFDIDVFRDEKGQEHLALKRGILDQNCYVRIHSECATGDIFGSQRCDCRAQLDEALQLISHEGEGLLIYLRGHEGRGIGLVNKIKAYALQDEGADTVDANLRLGFRDDEREYDQAVTILTSYGLKSIILLTNNRRKIKALEDARITVSGTIPLWTTTTPHNKRYLDTKRNRMGHMSGKDVG